MLLTVVQNFNPISLFLAVKWPKQRLMEWRHFLNSIFEISTCRMTKLMTFLETWDKIEQNRYYFVRKFRLSKFDLFWPEIDLTSGQMWKWMSLSNSTCQITHKTCITRHPCNIFIWWPHLTWPWPWPAVSIRLLLTWHLCHPFSSIFAEFALAAVSGLVSAADKAKRVSLDLWPDLDPTFDISKKILILH